MFSPLSPLQVNLQCTVGMAIATICLTMGNQAIAQVTPDATLPIPSRVSSSSAANILVEDGTPSRNGNHLFHSFETFSVPKNGQVTFEPDGASNIFSRVTGGALSRIRGIIQVNDDANLFLLNPNGIIFGPGAELKMNGSFAASSANRITFSNRNNRFVFGSRNQINSSDLLNLTTSIGLQYGAQRNGPIAINQSTLAVGQGQHLTVLGGPIRITGSLPDDETQLRAPQGRITLIGLRQGQLELEDNFSINQDESLDNQLANVEIRRNARLFAGNIDDLGNGDAGRFDIRGNHIRISDAELNTRNPKLGNVGLIRIEADRNLQLEETDILNRAFERVVNLETIRGIWLIAPNGSVDISNSTVETDVEGRGTASRIRIEAGNQITLDKTTLTTTAAGEARGGGIRLITNNILMRNSQLIASNQSKIESEIIEQEEDSTNGLQTNGLAGRIVLTGFNSNNSGLESIVIRNSQLRTNVNERADGNLIKINAPHADIRITHGSQLISRSSGEGNAGEIQIEADQLALDDSQLISRTSAKGAAGDIQIAANQLALDDSQLISRTSGQGTAGNIQIGTDQLTFNRSQLISRTSARGAAGSIHIGTDQLTLNRSQLISSTSAGGDAGSIEITPVNQLLLANGSRLISSTAGRGNAGVIQIETDHMHIRGWRLNRATGEISTSGLFSRSLQSNSNKAGSISITADTLRLSNGGQISSSTAGRGEGGQIDIDTQTLEITGLGINENNGSDIPGSGIFSRVLDETATGNANDIHINAETVRLENGGLISGSTFGKGDAGEITIEAQTLEIESIGQSSESLASGIYSRVRDSGTGNANDINIVGAESIHLDRGGQISTSVSGDATGKTGNIRIHSDRLLIEGSSRSPDDDSSQNDPSLIRSGIYSRVLNGAASSGGGNIDITSDLVVFSDEGRIQVNSRSKQEGGDGGNITINTASGFVVASLNTNSDIIASANQGNGGNIDITAQGIYGLVERPQALITNDIDASSQFGVNGNIIILTPGIDPSRSLVSLPSGLLTAEDRIDSGVCQVTATRNSRFISVGQGGILPAPHEMFRSTDLWLDLRLPPIEELPHPSIPGSTPPRQSSNGLDHSPLLEAQNWHVDATGAIHLVAPADSNVPLEGWQLVSTC